MQTSGAAVDVGYHINMHSRPEKSVPKQVQYFVLTQMPKLSMTSFYGSLVYRFEVQLIGAWFCINLCFSSTEPLFQN